VRIARRIVGVELSKLGLDGAISLLNVAGTTSFADYAWQRFQSSEPTAESVNTALASA
jgi:hypothetical protein